MPLQYMPDSLSPRADCPVPTRPEMLALPIGAALVTPLVARVPAVPLTRSLRLGPSRHRFSGRHRQASCGPHLRRGPRCFDTGLAAFTGPPATAPPTRLTPQSLLDGASDGLRGPAAPRCSSHSPGRLIRDGKAFLPPARPDWSGFDHRVRLMGWRGAPAPPVPPWAAETVSGRGGCPLACLSGRPCRPARWDAAGTIRGRRAASADPREPAHRPSGPLFPLSEIVSEGGKNDVRIMDVRGPTPFASDRSSTRNGGSRWRHPGPFKVSRADWNCWT